MKIGRRRLLKAGILTAGAGITYRLFVHPAQTHASDGRTFATQADTSSIEAWLLATAPSDIAALIKEPSGSGVQEQVFLPLVSN
jgi:hypothetical protein